MRAGGSLALLVAAAFVLAGPVMGQPDVEPEGELSKAQCYGHHFEEGFRSMDLFPMTVSQVEKGDTFTFELTIVNPWLHELLHPVAFVDISGIPGATFPGAQEPEFTEESGTLTARDAGPVTGPAGPSTHRIPFTVAQNATEVNAVLAGLPGAAGKNVWQLTLESPLGSTWSTEVPDAVTSTTGDGAHAGHTIHLGYDQVTEGGLGEWTAVVTYVRGAEPMADYAFNAGVYYNLSQSKELLVQGPESIPKNGQHTFSFDIVIPAESIADARLVYGGKTIAHHLHSDANAEDYGNYTKWNTMVFSVGDETVVGTQGVILRGADPNPLMKKYGQVLGFTATFLMLPAIFLGGVFGRGSVTAFNKLMGGARRRVLWHNATSYLLLIVSLLHMALFLVESFWDWSYGVLWGGLSLAAIIGLAVTGAFQRRFVAQWGFARWRFTHFVLGTVVIAFILVHILADGSHLSSIRETLFPSDAGA